MNEKKSALAVFENFADEYLNFEQTPAKNIFWLDTMEFLCKRLSEPQKCCPSFHVAGSKGKGSISKMIACILEEAGFSTGLYSSPHILNFSERIGTASGIFPEAVYEKSVRQLMESISSIKTQDLPGGRPVTWFELATLLGMLCFKNAETDYAVYEVGIGGRLDATNVITPICSCIGQIELEHTEFLGNTEELIAAEKAGIIKQGVPVVALGQKDSVKSVLRKKAEEKNAPIYFTNETCKISEVVYKNTQCTSNTSYDVNFFRQNKVEMSFSISSCLFKRELSVSLSMLGAFQAQNAAVAALAVKTAIPEIEESIIEQGLAKASLPGRFECAQLEGTPFTGIPQLILDGAHTVKSIGCTLDTFSRLFPSHSTDTQLLFACAADKNVEQIASLFKGKFRQVILTVPGSTKKSDFPRLKAAFDTAGVDYIPIPDYTKAISYILARASENREEILVTGSFYLVAEVKKYLMAQRTMTGNSPIA
ncbi:bifunctional folylpolyglutamate synthase/dihydrofolate synthase [Treponema sp.]|uniref:bifunctional folylpolyglutamate synthase/dihydrofolate synthase n=1 Tax=Treponema sp. TaxID=166 RepID=UPI003F00C053